MEWECSVHYKERKAKRDFSEVQSYLAQKLGDRCDSRDKFAFNISEIKVTANLIAIEELSECIRSMKSLLKR